MPTTDLQPTEPAIEHLEDALGHIDDREARYHVRQAMQILVYEEPGRTR